MTVLVGVGFMLCACRKEAPSTSEIAFSVQPQASVFKIDFNIVQGLPSDLIDFCTFDSIRFKAQILNGTTKSATVSLYGVGNVAVTKLFRDGVEMTPTHKNVSFHSPPSVAQKANLRILAAGQSASFTIGGICPTIYVVGQTPAQLHYPLLVNHDYEVQFSYHYTGGDEGKEDVFHGTLVSNKVNFRIE